MIPLSFGTFNFTSSCGIKAHEFDDHSTRAFAGLLAVPHADGGFDVFGTGVSPKQPGQLSIRFRLVATSTCTIDGRLDSFKQIAMNGSQTLKATHNDGTTRQISAKCIDMTYPNTATTPSQLPVTATFELAEPYWSASAATSASIVITAASATSASVNNTGTAPIKKIQMTISPSTACNGFRLLNGANGMWMQWNQQLAANDVLVIDTGAQTVLYNGYDAYNVFYMPPTQQGFMQFEPGSNAINAYMVDGSDGGRYGEPIAYGSGNNYGTSASVRYTLEYVYRVAWQ